MTCTSLDDFHVFALAHMIRRPIIVLAEAVVSSFADGAWLR